MLLDRIRKGERDKPTLGKLVPFGIFKAISEVARETMPPITNTIKTGRTISMTSG